MKRKPLFLTLFILSLWTITSYAVTTTNNSRTTAKNRFFCPPISKIIKNPSKQTWTTKNGNYKSYDMSFALSLRHFVGAQWVGANVGQITCVYKTNPKTAFPVMLIFHTLTYQPSGGSWSKNLGGYLNCSASMQEDCPYKMVLKPKHKNLYKEAEKLKLDNTKLQPPTE